MSLPDITPEELARLQELADLDIFGLGEDPVLQDLTRQAAELLDVPTSLVSFVLDGAQYFGARHGLGGWIGEAGGTPVEWAFCRFAVASGENFVVPDAIQEPKVENNPLVTQDGVRCYIGVPLITSKGVALGTLCGLGPEAASFSPKQVGALEALAKQVVQHLESRAGRS